MRQPTSPRPPSLRRWREVAYDFLFFWVHVLMHSSAAFGHATGHAQHHKYSGEESAYRTVNHSLVDGALQVLVNIAVQRHTPWGASIGRPTGKG